MEKQEFGRLVMEHEQQLYRIAKAILRRDEDCIDAAQEAVTKAFEKLDTLQDEKYAKTWLIRILIHVCYDVRAKWKKQTEFAETYIRPEEKKEDYSELYEALYQLEEDFRIVLILHYLEGYQVQEISEQLGIAEGTVKSRLYRGREKLKKLLEEE